MRAEVSVPEYGIRSADLLPVFREISSKITRISVEKAESLGDTVSCCKGCSACCQRIFVEVFEAEAYRLQDIIHSLPDDHRQRIQARFQSVRERLLQTGLYDDILHINLSEPKTRQELAMAYYRQNIACPFLENDVCSIYSERPMACREYLVASPAEECARPEAGGVRIVPIVWPSYNYLLKNAQHPGGKEHLVPLSLLPDWIAQNPEPKEHLSGITQMMRAFNGASIEITTSRPEVDITQPVAQDQPAPSAEPDVTFPQGYIVPDYAIPDALMVPHYGFEHMGLLEQIATAASSSIGVILLTPEPEQTQAFVGRQATPERFSILSAKSNTAWIRDRAPISVQDGNSKISWFLPQMPDDGRDADATLFESISACPMNRIPFKLAHGNLITGANGLALSTTAVFQENTDAEIRKLHQNARCLGISKWILFPPFSQEPSHHADVHVRFLEPDLAAIAWNLSLSQDRSSAEALMEQLTDVRPSIRILRIPMRSEGQCYASPLNWIQLGKNLLIPRYSLTQKQDLEQIRDLLEAEHFYPVFIDSPTLEAGGSLHCLTASIYV